MAVYKPRESDLQYARLALIERLATPAQVQRALGLLRRIAEAGGTAPPIGEVLVGQGTIDAAQNEGLVGRLREVEGAITDAQRGLHEVPRRLGQYEIIERIGRGGMGAVYKARQLNMDRVVALKILAAHLTRDRKYIKQFIREARAAGQLNHPNIVAVHEVGQAEGHFFICMEYVQGRTLSRELLAKGRLKTAEVLDVARQVAAALAAAEKRGIVHRDIKPDNLILTPRGDVRVTDLGLAKRLTDVTSASQSGWGCGTPFYMAPEQARNSSAVDIRADIYGLGATLYHLATGKLPFEAPNSLEVLMRAASEKLIPPEVLCPDIPGPLNDLIERMMSKDPDGRPPTAAALVEEIEQVRLVIGTDRHGRPSRRPTAARPGRRLLEPAGPSGLVQYAAWSVAALAMIAVALRLAGGGASEDAPRLAPEERGTPPEVPPGHGNGEEPSPAVPEPAETPEEIVARAALARLRTVLTSEDPADCTSALAECHALSAKAGRLAPATAQLSADLSARAELLAGRELRRRLYLAEQAVGWGRPSQALAQLDGAEERWAGTAAGGSVAAQRARIAARSARLVEELGARFAELTAAECFRRAEELLARFAGETFPDARDWHRAAVPALPAMRAVSEQARGELGADTKAVAEVMAAAEARMARWDFRGAVRHLDEAAARLPEGSRTRRRLELASSRAAALTAFRTEVIRRLRAADPPVTDRAFRKTPAGLLVREVHDGGIVLGDSGEAVRQIILWGDLAKEDPGQLLRLAAQVASRRSGEDQLAMGLLCMTLGDAAEAERLLTAAGNMPGMKDRVALHRRELEAMASPDEQAGAEKLESQVRADMEALRPTAALAGLGRLLAEFRRAPAVSSRREVLRALLAEVDRDCVLAGPFSGRAYEFVPGCLRLSYDFSREEEARDWTSGPVPGGSGVTWLHPVAGNFRAVFRLSGRADGARLSLAPRMRQAERPLPPLVLEAGGPTWRDRALPAPEGAGSSERSAETLELELTGAEAIWGTPQAAGRVQLPAELLDALAAGRLTGWQLTLELPAGARALGAEVDCRFGAEATAAMRAARAAAGRARLRRAEELAKASAELGAADLARVADGYRDVAEVATRAELARAAALVEAGRAGEARAALLRFMQIYHARTELLPRAAELLEAIGSGAGAVRAEGPKP